jgi:hypothetical protein
MVRRRPVRRRADQRWLLGGAARFRQKAHGVPTPRRLPEPEPPQLRLPGKQAR